MSFQKMSQLKTFYVEGDLSYRQHNDYEKLVGTEGTTREDYDYVEGRLSNSKKGNGVVPQGTFDFKERNVEDVYERTDLLKEHFQKFGYESEEDFYSKIEGELGNVSEEDHDRDLYHDSQRDKILYFRRSLDKGMGEKSSFNKTSNKMKFINLSYQGLKADLDKKGLKKLIILPDYNPGKGRLPTGSVAVYDKQEHVPSAEFLGPDIGCGMILARFDPDIKDIEYLTYKVGKRAPGSGEELGSLGSGNHFINFYRVNNAEALGLNEGDVVALVHSGSRLRGKQVFDAKLRGDAYLEQYQDAAEFGVKNRGKLLEMVQDCADVSLTTILDLPHNTLEETDSELIYRKGAVKTLPEDYSVVPSFMGGKAVIVKANENVSDLENSMIHGTGRLISRSKAKEIDFDSSEIRDRICIPNFIYDNSIKTEAPHCYRSLDEVLPKMEGYISIVGELEALSYIGN